MKTISPLLFTLCVLFILQSSFAGQPDGKRHGRLFGKGNPFEVDDLPDGELKGQLKKLSKEALKNAMKRLHKHTFSAEETKSLRSDSNGMIFYTCELTADAAAFDRARSAGNAPRSGVPKASVPIATPPAYHSKPGSTNILYLDFNGHVIESTAWNQSFGILKWETLPFDLDGDETTFNDNEQDFMLHVWQRVAEDYAPFDVDITTEEPATITQTVGRIVFTKSRDKTGQVLPHGLSSGGIAFLDVFNVPFYGFFSPAFVYYEKLPSYSTPPPLPLPYEDLVSEAASHEFGHNLGLSHDGTSSAPYYGGHGTGNTSWGPIMGTGYLRNVTQWTKGEYFDANNTEDDLAIMSSQLGYRPDDHGNTNATASTLAISGTSIIAGDPRNRGIIEQNTDDDVFVFATEGGTVTLNINPWRSSQDSLGGNLDILAELYNSSGGLEQASNTPSDTAAVITKNLPAGVYYLHVKNEGTGTPLANPPSGYTNYGSLGQYFIDGTIVADVSAPTVVQSISNVTAYGGTSHTFTVTYSDNYGIDVSSLDDNDIRITAPGGFDVPATFVSVDVSSHGSPRVATYSFSPPGGFWDFGDNNTYTATIQANQIRDLNGNFVATGTQNFSVNVPAFALANVSGPANGIYKAGTNLDFSVTYTQPVDVTGSPRIPLTIGAAAKNATYVSGTGTATIVFRYTVLAGDTDTNGIASASPISLNGGTIKNSIGTDGQLTFTPPNTTAVLVDTTAPTLTSVTAPANATYGAGRYLDFTVNFNETVYVTGGVPSIGITVGSTAREATYVSGGGSSALTFRYIVQNGETDSNGIANASPVLLNGAAIQDLAGNNATLAFTPPNTTGVLVDTVLPAILDVTGPIDGEYLLDQNLDFIVHFDDVVYVANGLPTIALTIGSTQTIATYQSGSGSAYLTFRHAVAAGEVDPDGIACASPIVLNGATIRDNVGNDAGLTFTPPTLTAVIVNAAVARVIVTNANNSGAGSLRQAMIDVPAGGIIDFDPTYFNVQRTINTTAMLHTTKSLTINGPGSKLLTISGNNTATVIVVHNCNVTLIGMTITGGNGDQGNPINNPTFSDLAGGVAGYYNCGLTMIDCTVTGNHGHYGGGIYHHGTLIMRDCTVANNQANNTGSNSGGGISMQGGSMLLVNCTVSGNSCSAASGCGGGVLNFSGTSTVINCTITNNTCGAAYDAASGYRALQDTTYLFNTIVAGNVNNNTIPDIYVTEPNGSSARLYSKGYNIIGNPGTFTAYGNGAVNYFQNNVNGDQVGSPSSVLDPVIAALADNGGPTQTHLIQPNSKAYNKGSTVSFAGTPGPDLIAPITDQRGYGRPRGAAADVGAVEAQVIISPSTIPNVLVNTAYSTVTFSASGGTPAYVLSFSGSLPTGMTCNGTTLSGTPTQVGDFPFTINATDSNGVAGSANYVLHVTNQPRDMIVDLAHTGNFTQGDIGKQYTVTVTNSGSASTNATITATMTTLPAGLTATSFTGAGWTQTSLSPPTATFAGVLGAFESDNKLVLTVNVAANATSPKVPTVTVSGGGQTNTANDTDSDSTVIIANQAPQISGTAQNQAINDNATLALFNGVTIFDANSDQVLLTTVTVGNTTHGDLTTGSVTAAGFTNAGGGSYTFSGAASAATNAIRQLVFAPAPNRVAPGNTESTTFSISVNDNVAAPVTDNTTSVVSTSINDTPAFSGTVANQTVNDTQTLLPFSGVTVTDPDVQSITLTVTLDAVAKGTFTSVSLNASGFANSGGGVYTFTGTAAAATTAIRQLVFAPTPNRVAPGQSETTTFTLSANDGIAAPVTDNTTTVISNSTNDAPAILGVNAGQVMNDNETTPPFAIVIVRDVDNPEQTLSVSVTLDNAAKGAFTAASLTASGFASAGNGVYTFSGTTTAATAAIRKLIFTPVPNRVALGTTETTTFTISASDNIAAPVSDSITTVIVTSVNDAPTISGSVANQAIKDNETIAAFSGVTIADPDIPTQTQSVSVTLDTAAKGSFTAASLSASGFASAGNGSYTFSGSAAAATTAIRKLVFAPAFGRLTSSTPEKTTFTIAVNDGVATTVQDNTTSVISSPAPIVITSPATATPSNAGTGQTVTFSIGISGGSGTVVYTWDFGDGSPTVTGETVTHVYPVEGTYTATVTITDTAGGQASSSTSVTSTAPLVGEGLDSDGDGVSDDVETELGSNPLDAGSTPTGAALSPDLYQPLNILKAQIKLTFSKTASDSISIGGTLHIYKNFSSAGKKASMIVGSVVRNWTLDAKGKAKTADSQFKLMVKAKKKVVNEQDAKFTATFKKVTLAKQLEASGLKNMDAKNAAAKVTFSLIMNGVVYRKAQDLLYTSKKDKGGSAKMPKIIKKK